MSKKRRNVHAKVVHPPFVRLQDLCQFVEAKQFDADWEDIGFTEEDLERLQIEITIDPKRHPVIEGTGGLRKMRFAPIAGSKGKSGSARVCYSYFEAANVVLLVLAYPKNQQLNLTKAQKAGISRYLDEQTKLFDQGRIR